MLCVESIYATSRIVYKETVQQVMQVYIHHDHIFFSYTRNYSAVILDIIISNNPDVSR